MSFDMDLETTMREEPEELDSHAKPATLLWCDFETTGLKKPSQPIQIGIIITDNDLNEIASGEWMINEWPDLHWEEGARRMHEATGLATPSGRWLTQFGSIRNNGKEAVVPRPVWIE